MGFDLRPRNKIGTFSMGSFSYGWMMDEGVGLVVGYSKGIEPGSYLSFPVSSQRNINVLC